MTKDEYRKETWKHIIEVRSLLLTVIEKLLKKAARHDASKLQPPEFDLFAESMSKFAKTPYGSKQYEQILKDLKPALDHHYAKNAHHPNHHAKGIRGMNLIDLIEMLCDWATKKDKKEDIKQSIILNQKRFGYSDDLKLILLNTLRILG